ncbi:MAG: UTP--glucose-1-phosphate uridylyltransferase GalU [Gammaproteobacteria bacterium]
MTVVVKKAIFPVAGLGTRFLPATKANPKEMLPVVDKPLIQYAAEEAEAAGITELIFVTGRSKNSIIDHFDKAYELEAELEKKNKQRMLEIVQNILPPKISCVYIRQAEPLGLGHAILCAKPVIGNEPFAILLADDLIDGGKKGCLSQMVEVFDRHNNGVIAVERVPQEDSDKYGIVEVQKIEDKVSRIKSIVEKPDPADAPSNLAVVGRYILPPTIMGILEKTGKGAGGEIQLTDGIAKLLEKKEVQAWEFDGTRYDCGSKLGYLQATVEYALKHPELKDSFKDYLSNFSKVAK